MRRESWRRGSRSCVKGAGARIGWDGPAPDCYGEHVFGMGLYEFLVIVGIALMLFSPRELPKIIKGFARVWGSIRRTADEFKEALMEDEDLRAPVDEIKRAYHGTRQELRQAEDAARRELAKARMEARMAERRLSDLRDESAQALDGRVVADGASSPDGDDPDPDPGPDRGPSSGEDRAPDVAADLAAGRGAAAGANPASAPKGAAAQEDVA